MKEKQRAIHYQHPRSGSPVCGETRAGRGPLQFTLEKAAVTCGSCKIYVTTMHFTTNDTGATCNPKGHAAFLTTFLADVTCKGCLRLRQIFHAPGHGPMPTLCERYLPVSRPNVARTAAGVNCTYCRKMRGDAVRQKKAAERASLRINQVYRHLGHTTALLCGTREAGAARTVDPQDFLVDSGSCPACRAAWTNGQRLPVIVAILPGYQSSLADFGVPAFSF